MTNHPCPFCGSTDLRVWTNEHETMLIECETCLAAGPSVESLDGDDGDGGDLPSGQEREAWRRWNERAAQP